MKIICKNGFYKFFPAYVGEIRLWENRNGTKLFPVRDFWTFESLAKLPDYSFKGHLLSDLILASENFAGLPEEVLAKNKLTYNVKIGMITPRALANLQILSYSEGAYLTFPKLPQAFALDKDLQPISGFEAFADVKLGTYKIERLFYETF